MNKRLPWPVCKKCNAEINEEIMGCDCTQEAIDNYDRFKKALEEILKLRTETKCVEDFYDEVTYVLEALEPEFSNSRDSKTTEGD